MAPIGSSSISLIEATRSATSFGRRARGAAQDWTASRRRRGSTAVSRASDAAANSVVRSALSPIALTADGSRSTSAPLR